MNQDTEALKALVALAEKATPGPWTKVGSAKRTLFTTAQGQQTVAPDKAFLPVEIVTCLRHAEQAQADCDFVQAARNAIPALERLLASQTQGEESVNPADIPTLAEMRELFSSAPVASQMGEPYKTALAKINCIRNSIIGMQGFHFSMHAYPLVAALNAAGFEGMSYEDAKAYHTKLRETGKLPGEEIPDVAAPAAGMDADSSPPLAESVGALLDEEVKATLKSMVEALTYAEASLGAVQATMNLRGDVKGSALMQTALDKVRDALHSRHMQQGK